MDTEQNELVEALKQQLEALETKLKTYEEMRDDLARKSREIERQIKRIKMKLTWLLDERG